MNKIRKKILMIIGIICILYFIVITVFIGYLNVFNLIWIFIGVSCIVIHKQKVKIINLYKKTHKSIRLLFSVAVIAFLLSFIILEVLIIKSSKNINTENSFYVVLLGAGLNGSKPSLTLLQRIKIATKYLNENRNVRVIVSGGKGAHETYTEAEIMSKLLQNNGIEKERIIIEDRSANTYENLTYSKELIDINKKVIIVTSGFHLFRAKLIARKLGYKDIGSIASKPPLLLLPNYYVREYFAVLKELIMNRI